MKRVTCCNKNCRWYKKFVEKGTQKQNLEKHQAQIIKKHDEEIIKWDEVDADKIKKTKKKTKKKKI